MQIVVLDGHAVNPGDLSWDCLREFGTLSVYDRTPPEFAAQRLIGADVAFVCKTVIDEAARARGALCVSQDVADALESGRLRAYAADVAAHEPILRSDPLLEASNCILTPHIAWAPRETRQRLLRLAAENLRAFLNGTPVNRVN